MDDAMTRWANAGLSPNPEAIRDHVLIGLLQNGAELPPDMEEQLSRCHITFRGNWFGLIALQVVAVDAFSYIKGLGHASYSEAHLVVNMLELLQEKLKDWESIYLFKVQSEIMCLVCGESREDAAQRLSETAEALAAMEKTVDGVRLFAVESPILEGYGGIKRQRQLVRQLYEYRVLHLDTSPVLRCDVLEASPAYPAQRDDIVKEQEVLSLFKSGQFRQAAALFGSLFERDYLALANPLLLLKHKCAQYLDALISVSQEMLGRDLKEELNALGPERRLLEAETFPEIRAQMEHFFGQLNDLVLSCRRSDSTAWIMDVKNYIRGNYTDPDLNVNRLADAFGKNPSYLSRSFLRLTGESILDYIHKYRIQEAKILIGRGETLANVSSAVGYSNMLTMSRAFKKYEGMTPGKLKKE